MFLVLLKRRRCTVRVRPQIRRQNESSCGLLSPSTPTSLPDRLAQDYHHITQCPISAWPASRWNEGGSVFILYFYFLQNSCLWKIITVTEHVKKKWLRLRYDESCRPPSGDAQLKKNICFQKSDSNHEWNDPDGTRLRAIIAICDWELPTGVTERGCTTGAQRKKKCHIWKHRTDLPVSQPLFPQGIGAMWEQSSARGKNIPQTCRRIRFVFDVSNSRK